MITSQGREAATVGFVMEQDSAADNSANLSKLELKIQKGARIGHVPKNGDEQRTKAARPNPIRPPYHQCTRAKNIRSNSAQLSENLLCIGEAPDHWKRKYEKERVWRLLTQFAEPNTVPAYETDHNVQRIACRRRSEEYLGNQNREKRQPYAYRRPCNDARQNRLFSAKDP